MRTVYLLPTSTPTALSRTLKCAQLYLTYLGLAPGAIDGLLGRFTRAALHEFQERCGLAVTDAVDEKVLLALRQEVERLAG